MKMMTQSDSSSSAATLGSKMSIFVSSVLCLVCLVCKASTAVAASTNQHQMSTTSRLLNNWLIGAPQTSTNYADSMSRLEDDLQQQQQAQQKEAYSRLLTIRELCADNQEECRTGRYSEITSNCQSGLVIVNRFDSNLVNCVPISVFFNPKRQPTNNDEAAQVKKNLIEFLRNGSRGRISLPPPPPPTERPPLQMIRDDGPEVAPPNGESSAESPGDDRDSSESSMALAAVAAAEANYIEQLIDLLERKQRQQEESEVDARKLFADWMEAQTNKATAPATMDGANLLASEPNEQSERPNESQEEREEVEAGGPADYPIKHIGPPAAPSLTKKSHPTRPRVATTQASTIRVSAEEAKRFIQAQRGETSLIHSPTTTLKPGPLMAPLAAAAAVAALQRQQQQHQPRLVANGQANNNNIRHHQQQQRSKSSPLMATEKTNNFLGLQHGQKWLVSNIDADLQESTRLGPVRSQRSGTPSSALLLASSSSDNKTESTTETTTTLVDADGGRLMGNTTATATLSSGGAGASNASQQSSAQKLKDWEELQCNKRRFTFRATKRDSEGNYCTGLVATDICYGACDTGEIADWLFPYKRSIHKVCRHGQRARRRTTLSDCSSAEVDESLRHYHYVEAIDCVCKKCTSIDTTCLGTMSTPHLQHKDEALREFERGVILGAD